MEKYIENNKIIEEFIKKTSKKINNQGFCRDKELNNPCAICILKEKCTIK